MLLSGSSKIRTGNLGTLVRVLSPLKSVIIVTPSNTHSNTTYNVADRAPLRCRIMTIHPKLGIYTYGKAPISYMGLTLRRIIRHGPSVLIDNVGRNSGTSIDIRCSNAVKITLRKYVGKVPSIKFSLTSFSTSTSFAGTTSFIARVIGHILHAKLPTKIYLGIGVPGARQVVKLHIYQVTRKG